MNTENIFSNEGQLESGESRDAEKEKVDNRENEKIMENIELQRWYKKPTL